MVIHHTASPIAANARGRSQAFTQASRPVASLIAVSDQASALASTAGSPMCSRFHAARQSALLTATAIGHGALLPGFRRRPGRPGQGSQARAPAPGTARGGGYLGQGLL